MVAQPLAKLGVHPVDDVHADLVLLKQRRGEPQQRLMVEYAVAQITNPVQCRRNVVSLTLRLRAAREHQAQVFPEDGLELHVEQRGPKAESQLGKHLVRCL